MLFTPVTAPDWGMPPQRALQPPFINHIYKKTGIHNIGNKPEFRHATTTLLAEQKLVWLHPQQKGQKTTSTYTSQLSNWDLVAKSQRLKLIQDITSLLLIRYAPDGETHVNPKILKWVWRLPHLCCIFCSFS